VGWVDMIKKIADKVWCINAGCNVYFLDFEEKMLIDTGDRANRHELMQFLDKVVDFGKVNKVIFTHLHHDHIGNFDLFPNASFYASKDEIEDFMKNRFGTVLDREMAERFNVELLALREEIGGLRVVETPGHTRGSICLWYEKEKILFTGDTLLKGGYGRTDLPTSSPKQMNVSAMKLLELPYKKMCPGHDY
jgi:hydroxyacylglutathione hydrolase